MKQFPAWWPSSGLWRHGDFLKLWSAQVTSAFGSRISRTALNMVALLTIGAEPWEIGVLAALGVAPGVLVGIFLGGFIDSHAKRPILVGCDLVRAVLLVTVPAAAWFDVLTMSHLFVVAAGMGAATTLFQIADNTYLPVLIGRQHLTEGNAKLEATDAVAEIGGPGISGVLVELITAPFALLADTVTYLVSAFFLFRIRAQENLDHVSRQSGAILADIIMGVRACLDGGIVKTLFFVAVLEAFFVAFTYGGMYSVFVLQTLGLGPATYGVLVAMGGVGALLGALIARRAARVFGLGAAMFVLIVCGRVAALTLPFAYDDGWLSLLLLAFHQFVSDAFVVAYLIHAMSLRQTILPQAVLGRANAAFHVTAGLLMPFGAAIGGVLASEISVYAVIWTGVIGGFIAPVVLWRSPIWKLRAMPAPI
ncbi:MAG: MFS transporter [Alphaproteobacteria bacterium]|jgi:hypothetical protein|nr:MFS transporter [Rhodospirillaceae bacterium]MDG2479497.1 MFS transporter [Alphaproteobacteria bacterium]MBT6202125.1 MFS transporter [Rhodospirillaceae bacterium]MBT6509128.1 MFS transporter [Rhodospirillaceae bacterium]MBT7611840.1 MFS transporter [Rhodospirillaceae bacterium]